MAKRPRTKTLSIRDRAQRAAMTSPVRLEVLEHLGVIGPASVRDLAERMGRTPHALHYHVRHLVDVGLLVRSGSRGRGVRREALYDVAAERIEVELEERSRGPDRFMLKTVRAILRRAERDFEALLSSDPARLEGEECFTGRLRARLPASARADVRKHVRAIERIFAREFRREHPPQTRLETLTFTALLLTEASGTP